MANSYYSHSSGQPVNSSRGSSSAMRGEFDAIAAAFDKISTALSAASSASDFKLIYQGQLSADPTQRYDGSALQGGDLYFNNVDKVLKSFSDGRWYAIPTSASVMLKSGGAFSGPISGTSASFTGSVSSQGFSGNGAGLTGFTSVQITGALGYRPVNVNGDTMVGTLNGTTAVYTGAVRAADFIIPSDERGKQKWAKTPADAIDRLVKVKKVGSFEDKKTKKRKVGISAQALRDILPEAVHEKDGRLGVDYGPAAMVLIEQLARRVIALEKKLK